jgi:hypothetical protein
MEALDFYVAEAEHALTSRPAVTGIDLVDQVTQAEYVDRLEQAIRSIVTAFDAECEAQTEAEVAEAAANLGAPYDAETESEWRNRTGYTD